MKFDRVISLLAFLVAVIALIAALQANSFADEANKIAQMANTIALDEASPDLRVVTDPYDGSFKYVFVTGCWVSFSNLTRYVIKRSVDDHLAVANNGGRAISLVGVDLFAGRNPYQEVSIFRRGDEFPIVLPIIIEPGVVLDISLQASNSSPFDSKEEATSASTILNLAWNLYFGDGSTLVHQLERVTVMLDRKINSSLDQECLN